jgi:tetratricopeptide (TPR) repeat protein
MPATRPIALFTAFLVLSFCVHSQGAESSPWLEIHSTHFTVITDAGENRGHEVALRFEQMRSIFAILLSKDRLNQAVPLTILAFENDKSYYRAAPLRDGQPIDAPGFFLPGEDQDFIVLNLSEPEAWRAVGRDLALMYLDWNYPPAQGWFDEGLTEYFSSIRVDNKQFEIGTDPASLTELLKSQTWLSLPDLFAAKHNAAIGGQAPHPAIYEAESWIVMHYLLHEKKLPETGTYFGLVLNQHMNPDEAIQQAYGMGSGDLEKAVKDYFQTRAASGLGDHSPVPVSPEDSTITSKSMPEADARALYAGVQVRIPERRDAGLKTLNDLATTPTEADKKAAVKQQTKRVGEDPDQLPTDSVGNALAHRILAWDHIQHGEYDEAFAEIRDAAVLNHRDMWPHYYLAAAKYRMAQAKHTEITGLANMLLDLKAVLEWNPEMADAYDLLALARNAGGTTTAAMQAERTAITLSPRNEHYTLHLAQIYIASKKWEAADALFARLKASNNPQIVAEVTELQSKSGAERKYGIPVNGTSAQPKFEAQKTPFDILDEDAAKREAAEKTHAGTGDKRATKFLKGRLVAVDCSNAPSAILTVRSDGGLLKLHAEDYRSLPLIGTDIFSCDWRDRQVSVNYKPSGAADGDLVSLEIR